MATAKKAGKTAAKKSAAAKRRPPTKTGSTGRKAAGQRGPGRKKDAPTTPPLWIPGTLDIVGGKLGLQTDLGFIPLEDVAKYDQAIGLVFQPAQGDKGEALRIELKALAAFIEEYGVAAITGVVTTCRKGP